MEDRGANPRRSYCPRLKYGVQGPHGQEFPLKVHKLNNRILIVAEELHASLAKPETAVVDCRFSLANPTAGQDAYERGHIPGAVFLDLDKDLAAPITAASGRHPLPDPDALAQTLGQLGISRKHEVVVYDDSHGGIAARAWWVFRWLGHDNVRLLDGGFAAWQEGGFSLEEGVAARGPAEYIPSVRDGLVLTTGELLAAGEHRDTLNLLDARDAGRFRGEHEPIDPVAGHIPGTRSLPFTDFVHDDGRWRSLEHRAAKLAEALGGAQDADWSVMCGSGVTACHLAITGLEAGFREPRVYIGSWSEWIRDPLRPVATGDT